MLFGSLIVVQYTSLKKTDSTKILFSVGCCIGITLTRKFKCIAHFDKLAKENICYEDFMGYVKEDQELHSSSRPFLEMN